MYDSTVFMMARLYSAGLNRYVRYIVSIAYEPAPYTYVLIYVLEIGPPSILT